MYPYDIFAGIDLYTVFLGLGVVAAILMIRICGDRMRLEARIQNLSSLTAVASVLIGYFSAILFQALYNIKKNGGFVISSDTGATFYGGLIGGVVCFVVIFFVVGKLKFKDMTYTLKSFFNVANIAAASITVAHGFGRLGCLMAGCCHGKETDAWYGIYMQTIGKKVVPIQLFEAIFLFILFAFFMWRIFKGKGYNLPIYMAAYGAWRFIIEYFRNDYRGSTLVDFLTPSQFIAIVMIICALGFAWAEHRVSILNAEETTDGNAQ